MTCVPSVAPATSDGSTRDGIVASRTGSSAIRPYFEASKACSSRVDRGRVDLDPTPKQARVAGRRRELGQPVEHEVDLRHRARRPDVAGAPAHRRPDGHRVHELREELLGVEAGDDARGRDLLAVLEHDARHGAVGGGDLDHAGAGADLGPGLERGGGERVGERGRAALREHGLARGPAVVAGGIGEEHLGRARGPRAHRGVADAAPREGAADRLVLEGLRDEVGGRHREHAEDRPPVGLAETAERATQAQAEERVAEARGLDLGRGLVAEVREEPRQDPDAAIELDERGGVVLGPGAERVDGLREVAPQGHGPTVRLRGEHPHLGGDEREPVAAELQLAGDGRPQPPDGVGEGRDADAGRQLLGDRGAADAVARLEHEDAEARPGQVRGGDEAVVARTDDDGVPGGAGVEWSKGVIVRPPSGRRT